MIVTAHITVFSGSSEIIPILESLEIPFQRCGERISFALEKGKEPFSTVHRLLQEKHHHCSECNGLSYHINETVQYTEEECLSAEYLRFRSIYHCIEPTNMEELYQSECCVGEKERTIITINGKKTKRVKLYRHCVQVEPFIIQKNVKWKPAHMFGCCEQSFVEVFCSDSIKNTIQKSDLKGLDFRPVIWKKTGEQLNDVWQLWPQKCKDVLLPGKNSESIFCEICGRMLIRMPGSDSEILVNQDRIRPELDFFQSEAIIGSFNCLPMYVISQKAYRFLLQNQLARALVFVPLGVKKQSDG